MNIVFVMVGLKYSQHHVIALYKQLYQYAPNASYWVVTDKPSLDFGVVKPIKIPKKLHLKGVWAKLWMFSSEFPVRGNIVYFDLDTIILGNPFELIKPPFSELAVVDCHWKPLSLPRLTNYDVRINSSLMTWNNKNFNTSELWEHFQLSGLRDYFVKKYVGIDRYLVHEDLLNNSHLLPRELIRSHKYESPSKPAPVVTFEEVDFATVDPTTIT
jgi:hypothetical protein